MKKWLFLVPFFLFSCKKKDNSIPLVNVNQYPSVITCFNVDTASDVEMLRFQINYSYNDSNRLDSIIISTASNHTTYRFDYSEFPGAGIIKLHYGNSTSVYDVITYDNVFYNITAHVQVFGVNDTAKKIFEYDSINRLKRYEYSYNNSLTNFAILQTYKRDTAFVHTEFPNSTCISNDTIKNTNDDLSRTLPYVLITKLYNTCGTMVSPDIVSALPLSNFINKLPNKIISNNNQVDYIYKYDADDRLIQTDIVMKNRSANVVFSRTRIKFSY